MGMYEGKNNQRGPPAAAPKYTEPKIVPYDDGWTVYEEVAVEF